LFWFFYPSSDDEKLADYLRGLFFVIHRMMKKLKFNFLFCFCYKRKVKMKATIVFTDSSYTQWKWIGEDGADLLLDVAPVKLFTGDVVEFGSDLYYSLVSSPVRSSVVGFCGVLVLAGLKTFGSAGSLACGSGASFKKKPGRLLYQCIPFDKSLPSFLIPYDLPVSFSKVVANRYIMFRFVDWSGKFPQGLCLQSFGDVTSVAAYTDYLLYAYGLFPRKKLVLPVDYVSGNGGELVTGGCDDRLGSAVGAERPFVFTMDPVGAEVFDDALSYWRDMDAGLDVVDIYIANPVSVYERYGLWSDFAWAMMGGWVSNLYLPMKRLSILPTVVVRDLSLDVGVVRSAFRLRLRYRGYSLVDSSFSLVPDLAVNARYSYGQELVGMHPSVESLLGFTRLCVCLDTSKTGLCDLQHRRMVAFWMEVFKQQLSLYFSDRGLSAFYKTVFRPCGGLVFSKEFAGMIGSYSYCVGSGDLSLLCTSPLRRRVDFMNLSILYASLSGTSLPADVLSRWIADLPLITRLSKKVSKISSQISLLSLFESEKVPEIVTGVVVDLFSLNRGYVYFPSYRISCLFRVSVGESCKLVVGESYSFRLYYFASENDVRRKIRVELI